MKSIEHQYDCKGNHCIVVTTETGTSLYGEPALYEHPAFFHSIADGKWYMAVTQYYEGGLPHELCEGVYELTKAGEDAVDPKTYNFFSHFYFDREQEECPWLSRLDLKVICPLSRCPQRDRRQGVKDGT